MMIASCNCRNLIRTQPHQLNYPQNHHYYCQMMFSTFALKILIETIPRQRYLWRNEVGITPNNAQLKSNSWWPQEICSFLLTTTQIQLLMTSRDMQFFVNMQEEGFIAQTFLEVAAKEFFCFVFFVAIPFQSLNWPKNLLSLPYSLFRWFRL